MKVLVQVPPNPFHGSAAPPPPSTPISSKIAGTAKESPYFASATKPASAARSSTSYLAGDHEDNDFNDLFEGNTRSIFEPDTKMIDLVDDNDEKGVEKQRGWERKGEAESDEFDYRSTTTPGTFHTNNLLRVSSSYNTQFPCLLNILILSLEYNRHNSIAPRSSNKKLPNSSLNSGGVKTAKVSMPTKLEGSYSSLLALPPRLYHNFLFVAVGYDELLLGLHGTPLPSEDSDIAEVVAFLYGQSGEAPPPSMTSAEAKQAVATKLTNKMRELVRVSNFLRASHGITVVVNWNCQNLTFSFVEMMRKRLELLDGWRSHVVGMEETSNPDASDDFRELDDEKEPPKKKKKARFVDFHELDDEFESPNKKARILENFELDFEPF
jgi:hypothetical protein